MLRLNLFLSEGYLNHANLSQTDVFHNHHDYELFLLNQEIDTPSDNLSHQESHDCEKLCQDDPFFTHATDFSLTFTLPHFMPQHNCEEMKPTDAPIRVPTITKGYSGHAMNPACPHKLFSSQVSKDTSSNSCRILGLTALNSLLQYVNWLVWEVCSVN